MSGNLEVLLCSYAASSILLKLRSYFKLTFSQLFPLASSKMSGELLIPIIRNDIFSIPCPRGVKFSHLYLKPTDSIFNVPALNAHEH